MQTARTKVKAEQLQVVRMHPEETDAFWDHVEKALREYSPDTPDDVLRRVYTRVRDGDLMVCLLVENKHDGSDRYVVGVTVLDVVTDPYTDNDNLLMWFIKAYEVFTIYHWRAVRDALQRMAKMLRCAKIIGETSEPGVEQIAKALGAHKRSTLYEYEVQ